MKEKEEREVQQANHMEFMQLVHATQRQSSMLMKITEQYLQHQMQQQQ